MNKKIFFDIKEILKEDYLVNIIYSARGLGKTYSALKYAYDVYDTTGMGAIYLRRYKTEFQDFKEIYNPLILNNDIDDKKIKYSPVGRKFIDTKNKKTILKGIPLAQGIIKKSQDFSNINLIIFDEFILDNGNYQYIPDEFKTFNNFVETVSRLRELTQNVVVKIVMLANSGNRNNPYFLNYNIPIFEGNKYVEDDLIVYKAEKKEFSETKKKTRWGKFLLRHTKMEKYIFGGEFDDNKKFLINQLPQKTQYMATMLYLENKIGMYKDLNNGNIIFSKKYNEQNKNIYALTKKDKTPDYMFLNKKNNLIKAIIRYNELGKIRFDDYKIQAIFYDILKLL